TKGLSSGFFLIQFGEEDLFAVVCQGGGYRVHAGLLGGAAGELKGILDIPPLIHHRERLLG
ncbi:unnamed protein product, partial [marine sediment metagenome]